ncbi:uncharacterized protein LOC125943720 [Dermacentor silvarum]|uniref:uncharacterized protein LOC125943720 n=1 Tax=Dermacentor silvarum TaxID=543639 RepID=UPI002101C0FD|nr:uncharacterized protein LOC125943720 [Dermacentor silvarum]
MQCFEFSWMLQLTSTPCPMYHTVPQVGEDFTVGGLTALVQEVSICEMSPSASSAASGQPYLAEPLLQPRQQVQQQQPELSNFEHQQPTAVQPLMEMPAPPGADTGNNVPLAKRLFSVATAGDLSTILECSKEDKLSSSSQHSVGVATLSTTTGRPPAGGSSALPAVQEEPDDNDIGGVSTATPAPQEKLQEHGEGTKQAALAVACKDPFSEKLRCTILNSWQPQESDQEQLLESSGKCPELKADAQITLGKDCEFI